MCPCVLSHLSCVWLFATLCDPRSQAPLSMGFSRQEYWSRLPCPPPGDLPEPGIEPVSLTSLGLAGRFSTTSTTWEEPAHCPPNTHIPIVNSERTVSLHSMHRHHFLLDFTNVVNTWILFLFVNQTELLSLLTYFAMDIQGHLSTVYI